MLTAETLRIMCMRTLGKGIGAGFAVEAYASGL